MKPRFQFGSHCAVTVAIAAKIIAISAVANKASISVKPAVPFLSRERRISRGSCATAARC